MYDRFALDFCVWDEWDVYERLWGMSVSGRFSILSPISLSYLFLSYLLILFSIICIFNFFLNFFFIFIWMTRRSSETCYEDNRYNEEGCGLIQFYPSHWRILKSQYFFLQTNDFISTIEIDFISFGYLQYKSYLWHSCILRHEPTHERVGHLISEFVNLINFEKIATAAVLINFLLFYRYHFFTQLLI